MPKKSTNVTLEVAALAFKTAINLELKRRENDKRILALRAQMKDMMEAVLL